MRTETSAKTGRSGASGGPIPVSKSAFWQKLAAQTPDAAGTGAHILQAIVSDTAGPCGTAIAGARPAPACKTMNATAAIQQTALRAKLFRMPQT